MKIPNRILSILTIILLLAFSLYAQNTTKKTDATGVRQPCPKTSSVKFSEITIKSTGDIDLIPCTGKSLLFNSSPLMAAGGGISTLNGLTGTAQTFVLGSAGSTPAISSIGTAHTFNFPYASASKNGLLSLNDWTTFNNKLNGTGAAYTVSRWDGSAGDLQSSSIYDDDNTLTLNYGNAAAQFVIDKGANTVRIGNSSGAPFVGIDYGDNGIYFNAPNLQFDINNIKYPLANKNGVAVIDNNNNSSFLTLTNGQIAVGSTGATPVAATLTAGKGITITNGAGSISLATNGLGELSTATASAGNTTPISTDSGKIYKIDSIATVTLPAPGALTNGYNITVILAGGGSVKIPATTQYVLNGASVSSGATVDTINASSYGSVKFVLIDSVWYAVAQTGTLTITP